MNFTPSNAVWELTYACNMRCKHCGSSCGEKYPDELSNEEALALCDDLGALGLRVVTLSGGEPFLRKDWDKIAGRLRENGVTVNAISNGWYIDEQLVRRALDAGIVNIGVSLDGVRETHDFIRMKGAFDHVMKALEVMSAHGMPTVVCTSVHKRNMPEIPALYTTILEKKVQRWQFQIASPMGNLLDHKNLVMEPDDIDALIDMTHEIAKERKVIIDLADDIGYYNSKITEIRNLGSQDNGSVTVWAGCNAGKCVMGVRANGDISGCLSIRDPNFIEGNIRKRSLDDIWNGPDSFRWNRKFAKAELTGFCAECQYAPYCLGGCTGAKITLSGSLYENRYCSYRNAMEKEKARIASIVDMNELKQMAKEAVKSEAYQAAQIYLDRALEIDRSDREALNLLALAHFFMDHFEISRDLSNRALAIRPDDAYAHKGLGLSLARLGDIEAGLEHLGRAIEFADDSFTDPYYDCAVILSEQGRERDAIEILEKGRSRSARFTVESQGFFDMLTGKTAAERD